MIIIFKNLDNTCGIIHPAPEALEVMSIEDIALKDVPSGLSYRICALEDIPTDRYFREAWADDGGVVNILMSRAKDVHMNNVRNARDKKFIEMGFPYKLDSDLEEAIIPIETRTILQTLRNIPQTLDFSGVSSPEELRGIWPRELR